jgi:putative tryptophan/tyrosine transport system substrate-binding protein
MHRRAFLIILGAGAALPFATHAQQAPTIGFVHARSREETVQLVAAFRHGLAENGFVEGKDVSVEYRFADGNYGRLPELISELLKRPAAVLVTGADPAALAGKQATTTVPILFSVGGDPVELGLVKSFSRPVSNITGMTLLTSSLEPKRLGLFRQVLPPNTTIGALFNPSLPFSQKQWNAVREAAHGIGQSVQDFWASNDPDLDRALEGVLGQHVGALLVSADPFFDTKRQLLVNWSAEHKIATMYQFREYVRSGGLMSYGIDLSDAYRQLGSYAAQILKGEKPADLPAMQPTKFEFVVNLKTANALGIKFPPDIVSIADEVIE